MSITRYRLTDYVHLDEDLTGEWVRYSDHVAALRACEQRVREDCNAALTLSLEQNDPVLPPAPYYDAGVKDGYAAGLNAARERAYTLMEHAIRLRVEAAIRSAAQLWSCDPADCPACDCGMDDEQRTRIRTIAASEARDAMNETSGHAESDADLAGYLLGKREGVQAARDAVAECRVPWPTATGDLVNEGIDEALAAIDALRGDTND